MKAQKHCLCCHTHSNTVRYVRLTDLGRHGESEGPEDPSLLSYTLRYVSLTDLGRLPVWVVITDVPVYMCE